MKMKQEDLNKADDPEYGVESRPSNSKEEFKESSELLNLRLKNLGKLSSDQVRLAKLLQLRLKMEEFVKDYSCKKLKGFSGFLKTYTSLNYSKQKQFAKDINISPVLLSQVINQHRKPGEILIKRLTLHSEKVFANVGGIDHQLWFRVYYQDEICENIENQKEWKEKQSKYVKFKKDEY